MGYLSQSRRSSLPLKFFEKNRNFFFCLYLQIEPYGHRKWKNVKNVQGICACVCKWARVCLFDFYPSSCFPFLVDIDAISFLNKIPEIPLQINIFFPSLFIFFLWFVRGNSPRWKWLFRRPELPVAGVHPPGFVSSLYPLALEAARSYRPPDTHVTKPHRMPIYGHHGLTVYGVVCFCSITAHEALFHSLGFWKRILLKPS